MKESDEELRNRIRSMSIYGEDDIPGIDPQACVHELCRYFLGEDWYIVDPVNNAQANAIILYEIEKRYKNSLKRKHIAGQNTFHNKKGGK